MLVLSRKLNEEILIGDNIRIRVLDTLHGRVRIGVAAPANVRVDRLEVAERHTPFSTDGELPPDLADATPQTATK